MRQAYIFYKDQLAGILTENDAGYEFRYLPEYISLGKAKAVSMTLPLQEEAYTSPVLFPFFDGLIPEGWLLHSKCRIKGKACRTVEGTAYEAFTKTIKRPISIIILIVFFFMS